MRGQLRDAAQGGRREETEADRAQGTVRSAAQETVYRVEKLVRDRRKGKARTYEGQWESPVVEPRGTHTEHPVSATGTEPAVSPSGGNPMRINAGDSAYGFSPVDVGHTDPGQSGPPQIKTKDAYIQHQGSDTRLRKQKSAEYSTTPSSHYHTVRPVEQGRQKFILERQTVQQAKGRQRAERTATARQWNQVDTSFRRASMRSGQPENKPGKKAMQEAVSGGKRQIKAARSGVKVAGRTSRQTVKTAEHTARTTLKTAERGARAAQKTAQATVKATQRAVQAARVTTRTAATTTKAVAKATVSAFKAAVAAAQEVAAAIAAGGGAVIAVLLVLCLAGALLLSPLGIFFSGEGNGTGGGQTISSVVREINQEYNDRVESLKTGTAYDELGLSGSRAPWPEILAIYAVKTTSDPTNGLEVVTMDNTKKELLKQVFWDMNELSSFTSTVPGEDDEEDTTTLHIIVTAKTASEMADIYGFNTEQRPQLAELLSDEYRELWSAVLYGIGTGDGEIVAVALSQVGNVGGQPYWSWYGFGSRVDWCAVFVSWCANECGYIDAGVVPKFAGCVQGSRWFKERGLWQDRGYTPNPGDVIFFDWDDPGGFSGPQDGLSDHVGIVERVENGRVYTIEGNSGDKCCQRSYPVGYYEIYGYGQLCP